MDVWLRKALWRSKRVGMMVPVAEAGALWRWLGVAR
jgi:hypothetical protein